MRSYNCPGNFQDEILGLRGQGGGGNRGVNIPGKSRKADDSSPPANHLPQPPFTSTPPLPSATQHDFFSFSQFHEICFCFCSKYFYSLLGVTGCPKLAFVACYICTFCLYSNVNEQSDNYTDLPYTHSDLLSVCQDSDWAGLYAHLRTPAAVDN